MEAPERLRVGEQGSGMDVKSENVKSEEPIVEENSPEEEPAKEPLFIIRFKDVVEARLADSDLSVDDLAAAMNLSRVQLYRKVKAISGASPVELVRTARLNRGYQLLVKGDKTVSEVAYEVGFTAPSYFTKCFKDEFGISPSDLC
jgi:AraC-like DNA-binding protein